MGGVLPVVVPAHPDPRHWPVLAWIRLRLPDAPAPMQLTGGAPPPPMPPLDLLTPEEVATDPAVRLYSYTEELGIGVLRLAWAAANPDLLNAEYREPAYQTRLPAETVRRFWTAVKSKVAELGPVPVEAADPYPS